jgi:methylmalonyl-CoA carboxyltransferase 5S subunit
MLGYYGATLGQRSNEVTELAQRHAKKPPITVRPADLLAPEWDKLRSEALALNGCNGSDEDVLTHAMFPQVAPKFFAKRHEGPLNVGLKPPAATAPGAAPAKSPEAKPVAAPPGMSKPVTYAVTVNGKTHRVTVGPAS